MNNPVILCVEDNIQVQIFNKSLFEAKGFEVRLASTLFEARKEIEAGMPDLIVLDIHLPDGNGLDFLRELRKTSSIPVIALTGDDKDGDMIIGFESGCDDYVPKPYTFPVLYARIISLMRRAERVPEKIVKGSLTLNPLAGKVFLNGVDLILSQKEFAVLLLFAQNEGVIIGADFIYEKVWKSPMAGDRNTLQATISKLRKKIEYSGYGIFSMRGQGYVFDQN